MGRLGCPLPLGGGEGGLVHEDVGLPCDLEDGAGRSGVTREHDLATRPRRPEHLGRRNRCPVCERNRLAPLQESEERPFGDTERLRRVDIEAPRAGRLDQRIAVRRRPVSDLEDDQPVVTAVDGVPRPQLDQLERIGELPEDPAERPEEVVQAGRSVHGERKLASAERKRLQHSGQTEVVVCVEVADEDLGELDQPDSRAQELTLGSLAAVEEDPVASPPEQSAGEPAPGRGNGAGGAEKDEVEIHAESLRGRVLEALPPPCGATEQR